MKNEELESLTLINNTILIDITQENDKIFDSTRIVMTNQRNNGINRAIVVASSIDYIQCGSIILYDPRNEQEVKIDGKDYRIIHLNSVYGFMKNNWKEDSENEETNET